jgi:hypothetical protein
MSTPASIVQQHPRWNLEVLREHIRTRVPAEAATEATAKDAREHLEIVSSLGRSGEIFGYHLSMRVTRSRA